MLEYSHMKFNIVTIFPGLVTNYTDSSVLGRGQKADAISVNAVNLREYSTNKHKNIDDTPYGGGAGMVMQVEPIHKALTELDAVKGASKKKRTVLMSPRGTQFDQRLAEKWANELDEITFVCGRYEGVDQRVADHLVDEEVSIGPYVLAGGELGAMVVLEAVSRLIPGVLGNPDSLLEETFGDSRADSDGTRGSDDILPVVDVESEYAQYSKPASFNGWDVPEILLSGDHKKIAEWRKDQSK